ncbi:MAG: cysteine desulfurase [Clostridia bacterium]|nr:cysteine desulfurase [Clostridia bacterium]
MEAYLDNSATTFVCNEAADEMLNAVKNLWGNPSSLHQKGLDAEIYLEKARAAVAKKIGASKDEIVFTSGGTQSNNIAVFGACNALKKRGNKIITTSVEHPSVSKAFDRLEAEGFQVIRLETDRFGLISLSQLEKELDSNTVFVSIMAVNNELGTIEPIEEAGKLIRQKSSAVFHVDAVQAFGKLSLNVSKIGCDLLSVSSHKIHGPKGAGALFVKKQTKLVSSVVGGGQERDIRPGTEPMPAIAGFFGAVNALETEKSLEKVRKLRDEFVSSLEEIDGVVINSGKNALPYIVNLSLPGYPSEAVLNFLSDNEVYVSSGSACAKGHKSPVLTAAGLDSALINSSLRVSLSRYSEKEELDLFINSIKAAMKIIRKK